MLNNSSYCLFFAFLIFSLLSVKSYSNPTLSDYGALPASSMLVMSSDGDLVAFRKTEGDKDLAIVFSLKDQKTLRALDISAIDPQGLYFIGNQQLIMRVSY